MDKNVLGFDITVANVIFMQMTESQHKLPEKLTYKRNMKTSFSLIALSKLYFFHFFTRLMSVYKIFEILVISILHFKTAKFLKLIESTTRNYMMIFQKRISAT